jgi:hypothetical protein
MNAGASTYAVPSPIKGSGTAWVLLGSWALSPARPTPIHPRHECRGLSALFGEYEGAIFDQNVDVERDLHGHPLSRGGVDALERCRYVYAVDAQGQGPSRVENEWTSCAVIHVYKCNDDRQVKKRGKAPTCCAITRYTSGKGHLPLDQSAMQPKGIMVTIRIGGEELLLLSIFCVKSIHAVLA